MNSSRKPNYARKYLVKLLAKLAQQSGHAEDCIAALTHPEGVRQFIAHSGLNQSTNGLHEVPQAKNGDAAVQLALLIAQADHHISTAEIWIHHFFNALKDGCVVVQGLNAGNHICLHDVLSRSEGCDFAYALKYVTKLHSAQILEEGAA